MRPSERAGVSKLGHVYLLLGRLDEAITQQRTALQMEPGLSEAHYGIGLAYQRQGQHQLAREHFVAYARLEPMTYLALTDSPGGVATVWRAFAVGISLERTVALLRRPLRPSDPCPTGRRRR